MSTHYARPSRESLSTKLPRKLVSKLRGIGIMSTHYAGELKQSKHKTDANGHVQFAELPDVVGKEAGVLADTIETPDCSVTVRVPWGKGSYHKH